MDLFSAQTHEGLQRWSMAPSLFADLAPHPHVSDRVYDALWRDHQKILQSLLRNVAANKIALVIVVEGWDVGGKSGLIRRMFEGTNPDQVTISHTIAPTANEQRHHFLKRFRDQLPDPGQVLVLDRSWYGRLLVERVDKLTPEGELFRSVDEINNFEQGLMQSKIHVMKFWLHVTPQQQRQRLTKRALAPSKRHKFKPADIRNYHQRVAYEAAANDMLVLTSTGHAPWHVIPADHKPFARLCAITQVIKTLEWAIAETTSGIFRG